MPCTAWQERGSLTRTEPAVGTPSSKPWRLAPGKVRLWHAGPQGDTNTVCQSAAGLVSITDLEASVGIVSDADRPDRRCMAGQAVLLVRHVAHPVQSQLLAGMFAMTEAQADAQLLILGAMRRLCWQLMTAS